MLLYAQGKTFQNFKPSTTLQNWTQQIFSHHFLCTKLSTLIRSESIIGGSLLLASVVLEFSTRDGVHDGLKGAHRHQGADEAQGVGSGRREGASAAGPGLVVKLVVDGGCVELGVVDGRYRRVNQQPGGEQHVHRPEFVRVLVHYEIIVARKPCE